MTTAIACAVLLAVAVQSVRAWRERPGQQAGQDFLQIWQSGPWGKQFYVDFVGLEVVLALWMLTHASAHGTWLVVIPCLLTMPVLGAMSAALYWIVCLGS